MAGGDYFYHGLILADADAARLGDHHVLEVPLGDLLYKGVEHRARPGGDAAGGHAHHHTGASLGVFTQGNRSPGLITDSFEFR